MFSTDFNLLARERALSGNPQNLYTSIQYGNTPIDPLYSDHTFTNNQTKSIYITQPADCG
jgi:hypothetical protein